ncbi:ABC transporter transmembrane domain-containing protein [Streptomyces sparsogenes]|uniref:ABC transporter transmembrane domain-containing protein n=1 Tax=Streptomyces sparsogenes TaxID=67365 RepID=UPI000824FDE4|nr:ABC transporter ATP-binding protein [Streptomyces sparsogenes]
MRPLPAADPGNPDIRSATWYLLWLAGRIAWPLSAAAFCGMLWLGSQALMPVVIREAIDEGLVPGDMNAVLTWAAVLLGLGVVQAVSGTVRRRLNMYNSLSAGFRTVQLVVRQANLLGSTLERHVDEGELVSLGTSDMNALGSAFDIVGRAVGAVISVVLVAVVLLDQSATLGMMLIVAVPAIVLTMGYTLRPLHRRQSDYRDLQGELNSRLTDVVAGLRVLRGVGGEIPFARSYRERSQRVRKAGSRVAGAEALIRGAQVLLPGLLVSTVTWVGARAALTGAVTPGELVAFYAYAAFLVEPLGTFTETADRFARAHVAARRAVALLAMEPKSVPATDFRPVDTPIAELIDETSGFTVTSGTFHLVVAPSADVVWLADRLGGYTDAPVRLDGRLLSGLPPDEVRRRILVVDNRARLFRGSLRGALDPHGTAEDTAITEALRVASAEDVVALLPDGLDTEITADGRRFSGGQRQRLVLARAVLADPDVLIVVDPTSAVDAHTEDVISRRLRAARSGRTTVLVSSSPLLLDHADTVSFLRERRVAATGTHRELLAADADYRLVIQRETGETAPATTPSTRLATRGSGE